VSPSNRKGGIMSQEKVFRFPGARPFEDTEIDRLLFNGREQEKEQLLYTVLRERLTVLYAKSGTGKSSLLKAGVFHLLRQRNFYPIEVRLIDPDIGPKIDPLTKLYTAVEEFGKDNFATNEFFTGMKDNLWTFFKKAWFWKQDEDEPITPVIVLDQFEELFNFHDESSRKDFITQIGDLANGRMPKEYWESQDEESSLPLDEKPPRVKIIISIREDFLGELEELSSDIPSIFDNRIRIRPLDRQQAEEAIKNPAKIKNAAIDTRPFSFAPNSVKAILDHLCKKRKGDEWAPSDEVSPFDLQLICRHHEEKINKRGQQKAVVKTKDLYEEGGMEKVLQNFYHNQLQKVGKPWKKRVRRLCEKGMITLDGWRNTISKETIKKKYKIGKGLLDKLVDNRLIRAEPRLGTTFYELSHDTLLDPIKDSRDRRRRTIISITGIPVIIILAIFIYFLFSHILPAYKESQTIERYSTVVEKGQSYEFNDLDSDAIKHYKEVLDEEENDFLKGKYNYELGRLLLKPPLSRKNIRDAIEYLKKAVECLKAVEDKEPKRKKLLEEKNNILAAAYSKWARALIYLVDDFHGPKYNLSKLNEAQDLAKESFQLKPTKDNYLALGIVYLHKSLLPPNMLGDKPSEFWYNEAKQKYKDAVKANPLFAKIYYELTEPLRKKKVYEKVAGIYAIALKLDPKEDPSYYYELGKNFFEIADYEKAVESFTKSINMEENDKNNKNNLDAFHLRGTAYDELKNYKAAVKDYRKAIKLDSKDAHMYIHLGDSLYSQGKFSAALKEYKKSIKIDDSFSSVYRKKGNILMKKEKYEEAAESFIEALKRALYKEYLEDFLASVKKVRQKEKILQEFFDKLLPEKIKNVIVNRPENHGSPMASGKLYSLKVKFEEEYNKTQQVGKETLDKIFNTLEDVKKKLPEEQTLYKTL
jgi:tetratricopeptide (TPR) repeat protein